MPHDGQLITWRLERDKIDELMARFLLRALERGDILIRVRELENRFKAVLAEQIAGA